jgi:hypothetical protein
LPTDAPIRLFARAATEYRGTLRVLADGRLLQERALHALPERRLTLTVSAAALRGAGSLRVELS